MARPRSSDYDHKSRAILSRSAELFASLGYDRASMSAIAAACGVSKAALYHYYRDKNELLFDVIRFHLEELLEAVEAANRQDLLPVDRLHALVVALLEAYDGADAQHTVQINELRLLPPLQQKELKLMERELVKLFSEAIAAVSPSLTDTVLLKPVTMSLFGMLNWAYLWFRSSGALSREDYANLVTKLIVDGTRGIVIERGSSKRRPAKRNTSTERI
jgi:TetR/AcrR family transcriptional regulator